VFVRTTREPWRSAGPMRWARSQRGHNTFRDMTCRAPGCDRPAVFGDIDHTVAYPGGPTHPGNLKCYCRKHDAHKTVCGPRGLGVLIL
jgi:hypothetical protein